MTGAEFVAKDLGMKVETTGPESLGIARKVRCSGQLEILHAVRPSATPTLSSYASVWYGIGA